AAHAGVVEEVRDAHLDPAPLAVLAPAAGFEPEEHPRGLHYAGEDVARPLVVVRVDVVEHGVTDALVRRVAEDPLHGGAVIGDRPAGVADRPQAEAVLRPRP